MALEINVSGSGANDIVRIWVNGTEITYDSSRSGYNTSSQGSPVGIDTIASRNETDATAGDCKIDDIIIYNGVYCAE